MFRNYVCVLQGESRCAWPTAKIEDPVILDESANRKLSGFRGGISLVIYGVVEGIIEQSGTPYFCFKDLDENKPSGSIRIRVETIDYFLRRYREEVIRKRKAEQDIQAQLAALEAQLRTEPREVPPELEQGQLAPDSWQREPQEIAGD